jgi:hypothetical protein
VKRLIVLSNNATKDLENPMVEANEHGWERRETQWWISKFAPAENFWNACLLLKFAPGCQTITF